MVTNSLPWGENGSSGGQVGTNSCLSFVDMSLSKGCMANQYESMSYLVCAFLLSCNLPHGFARLGVEEDDIANASRCCLDHP